MGLSWQQGPLGRDPNGSFITPTPMPERVLYVEPLRRRMSAELGGSGVVSSDGAVILFEPAHYPVACFPLADEMDRIADLVSFEPDKVNVTIDGEKLELAPGQTVVAHGADRNLSVDEVGGIELAGKEA
jgi:hypothetical protein